MHYDDSKVPDQAGRAVAGTYHFTVSDALDEVYKSGNPGVTLTLKTAAFDDRDINVKTRLVTVPNALWKVKEFLDSVGLPFSPPPETDSLVGRSGMAEYEPDAKGYLEVVKFIPASANNGPDGLPF